jgi:hypothetical protein
MGVSCQFDDPAAVEANWNVMAHAQKPDFVFRRKGRVHLNRRERHFSRLLAAEVCASAVVMLDTPCCEVVWRVLATQSHSPVSSSLPLPASPCAITFQPESTSGEKAHGTRWTEGCVGPGAGLNALEKSDLLPPTRILQSSSPIFQSFIVRTSFYVMPTKWPYVFVFVWTVYYFPVQHQMSGCYNRITVCWLCDTEWVFECVRLMLVLRQLISGDFRVIIFGRVRKTAKAIVSFVMSGRPSVSPHRTRLPLDGFSWHLIFEYSSKNCRVSLKSDTNNGYFTWRPIYISDHILLISS